MDQLIPEHSNLTPDQPTSLAFSYSGEGGTLVGLYLKNIFLSIFTLGLYRFWGQVEIKKYLFSSIHLFDSPFGYHATGKERFHAFLKAVPIIAVIFFLISILGSFGGVLLFLLFLFGQPFIMVGKYNYLLNRSSWSNVRFRFDGSFGEFLPIYLKGILLTVITLGIATPWYLNSIQHYFTNHSRLGEKEFNYNGNPTKLFMIFLKGYLLTLVTLGIYSFKLMANIAQYYINHTSLEGLQFKSDLKGMDVFKIYMVLIFVTLLTLGLGTGLAVNYAFRKFFSTLSLEGDLKTLDEIQGTEDTGSSAFSDGLDDAADILDGISGAF